MSSSSANASSPSFGEMITKIIDYKQLEVMDYLRSGALLAAFLVVLIKSSASGRGNLFAIGDVIGTGLCGLACYFFPAGYLSYQVEGQLDVVHQYIMQTCGAAMVALAWTRYRSLETRDAYCSVSHIVTRLLGAVIALMMLTHAQYGMSGSKKMTQQHVSFGIFSCCLWLVSHIIQLYWYNGEGKRAYGTLGGNRRDIHILITALFIFLPCFSQLAFPGDMISVSIDLKGFASDDIHYHFLRLFAVLSFMIGLQFLAALTYETDSDKKHTLEAVLVVSQDLSYGHYYFVQLMGAVLIGTAWARYRSLESRDAYCTISIIISRLIGSVLLLMLMLHAHFTLGDELTLKHITHSILGCVLWLLNTLMDLYNYNGKDRLSMGGCSPRDVYLVIIGLISFNMALNQFAFPQFVIWVLGGDDFAPDEVHIYKLQQVGILLIPEALTMLAAVNFASDRDRKARFEGILMLFALYLPMLLLYQLKHAISSRIWALLLMSGTHVTVALIGYCDGANCSWCSFLRLKSKAQ